MMIEDSFGKIWACWWVVRFVQRIVSTDSSALKGAKIASEQIFKCGDEKDKLLAGFEPMFFRVKVKCSNDLSYNAWFLLKALLSSFSYAPVPPPPRLAF